MPKCVDTHSLPLLYLSFWKEQLKKGCLISSFPWVGIGLWAGHGQSSSEAQSSDQNGRGAGKEAQRPLGPRGSFAALTCSKVVLICPRRAARPPGLHVARRH